MVLPQGTIPRGEAFFDPELQGKTGTARLAAVDRRGGVAHRPVGHREGVAALGPDARHDPGAPPTEDHHPGRPPVSLPLTDAQWPTPRPS